MSLEYKITLKNWDKASKALKGGEERFERAIKNSLNWSSALIQGEASKMAPVDTGRLRDSIDKKISPLGRGAAIGTNVKYAEFVHGDGTKKRSKPHFPPISALKGWSRRHNIDPFLVAKAIAEKGTKLIPFLKKPLEDNRGKIRNKFGQELESALGDIASKVK